MEMENSFLMGDLRGKYLYIPRKILIYIESGIWAGSGNRTRIVSLEG